MERTCQCGCGRPVSNPKNRFILGHSRRGTGKKPSEADYSVDANGCWNWIGHKLSSGYGTHHHTTAHRWYYEHYVGPIPAGYHVDHLCRNRSCVNPAHLEAVTPFVNYHRSSHPKLTEHDIREIRRLLARGLMKTRIAAMFGVSETNIRHIETGRRWAYVK